MRVRPLVPVLVGALALACGPPALVRVREPSPATVVARPLEPDSVPRPPSYEERWDAESRGGDPLAVEDFERGRHDLHLVLEAGRCYAVLALADGVIALELRDEHDHVLAAREGGLVRFRSVCPRWSSSFVLSVRVEGARARLALYEEDAPEAGSSASGAAGSAITR